jgi:hypothetical protein
MRSALILSVLAGQALSAGKVTVSYLFGVDENGKWPGGKHETALLVLRSPKKLRPLFITGRAEQKRAVVKVTLPDESEMGRFIDTKQMADLLDFGKTEGGFAVELKTYGSSRYDLGRRVGTAWLQQDPWPTITFRVTGMENWLPKERNDKPNASYTVYEVTLLARLEAGPESVDLRAPAKVTLRDAVTGKKRRPARMQIAASFRFRGSDAGLTGDDAGEVQAFLACEGIGILRTKVESSLAPGGLEIDLR